jgi:hypothetical protein
MGYVVRHEDIPTIAGVGGGTGRDTLLMKKAIGWSKTDPENVPEDWPYQLESVGVTWIKLWGRLRRIKCTGMDRVMYIIKGECVIQVADAAPEHARAGDYVMIPKGVEYEYEASVLEYLVINAPSYIQATDLRNDAIDGDPVRKGEDEWTGTMPVPSWRRTEEGERELI